MLAEVREQISVAHELLFQPGAIFRAEVLEDPLAGGSVGAGHEPIVPRRSPCAVRQALQPCPADDAVSVLPLDVRCDPKVDVSSARRTPIADSGAVVASSSFPARERRSPSSGALPGHLGQVATVRVAGRERHSWTSRLPIPQRHKRKFAAEG